MNNQRMLLFKVFYDLADQIDHLSVGRAPLVLRNIVQSIVKPAADAKPKMLIRRKGQPDGVLVRPKDGCFVGWAAYFFNGNAREF